jgi:hypothetical protein
MLKNITRVICMGLSNFNGSMRTSQPSRIISGNAMLATLRELHTMEFMWGTNI